MRKTITMFCTAVFLLTSSCFAQEQQKAKQSDKVKVSSKGLAEIKRQIRLMRAEMAELEEKMEEITGLHDDVDKTEKVPEESKPVPASDHSE